MNKERQIKVKNWFVWTLKMKQFLLVVGSHNSKRANPVANVVSKYYDQAELETGLFYSQRTHPGQRWWTWDYFSTTALLTFIYLTFSVPIDALWLYEWSANLMYYCVFMQLKLISICRYLYVMFRIAFLGFGYILKSTMYLKLEYVCMQL